MIAVLILLAVLAASLTLELSFIYVYTVANLKESVVWMPKSMLVIAYVLLPLGYLSDFVFNMTRGWIIFRESPFKWRGAMFTHRVQYHVNHIGIESLSRDEIAMKWARLLNAVRPGHIKRVP